MPSRQEILIEKVKPDLPIIVYPERQILPKLKENFQDDSITLETEMVVDDLLDMKNEGGIVCSLRPSHIPAEKSRVAFLCSLTHFKVKKGEPHYKELETYRLKRSKRLARQNRRRF
ncbi:MAG: hypothetical protein AAGI23_00010 [Bacteroidota bacterium]